MHNFFVIYNNKKQLFNPNIIYSKLIKCCINLGIKDFDIADDISNIIEHVLYNKYIEDGKIFTEDEIYILIVDMLEYIGKFDLSYEFKSMFDIVDYVVINNVNDIKNIISNYFNNDNDSNCIIDLISNKIFNTVKNINSNELPINIIKEIYFFYNNLFKINHANKYKKRIVNKIFDNNKILKDKINNFIIFNRCDIIDSISQDLKKLIESNVINISSINSIFSSVNITVNFKNLIQCFKYKHIFTEMEFITMINKFIINVANIIKDINNFIDNNEFKKYPIFLRFLNLNYCVDKYLHLDSKKNNEFCKLIYANFSNKLKNVKIR